MRRSMCLLLGALPFHPMALGSFASLKGILESTKQVGSKALLTVPMVERPEFQSPLLFVSPKHDGIRAITHVDPSPKTGHSTAARKQNKFPNEDLSVAPLVTCFSRFGRPLRGLFWIENELDILRKLCGDPTLCMDGELYIHSKQLEPYLDSTNVNRNWSVRGGDGFSFVSGLLQCLRSDINRLPSSMVEVSRLVPVPPKYCVFDVVRYNPDPALFASATPQMRSIQQAALAACDAPSVESLSVSPNRTPFVQRLRCINFLMSLLRLHQSHNLERTALSSGSQSPSVHIASGGTYVESVGYSLLRSIHDAPARLEEFNKAGYEGAVVRTSLNRYHAAQRKNTSPNGFRSSTAVKLLPFVEDEFVVLDVVRTKTFTGLECATKMGTTFRVSLAQSTLSEKKKEMMLSKLRGRRKANRLVVGTFVTLQFPSLLPSGIPRFPKIKGIRGGSGWYL